jgi:hypothetical protein
MRFEVFTAVALNITVFCNVSLCNLENTYLLIFWTKRLFDREDGGSVFRASENYLLR